MSGLATAWDDANWAKFCEQVRKDWLQPPKPLTPYEFGAEKTAELEQCLDAVDEQEQRRARILEAIRNIGR